MKKNSVTQAVIVGVNTLFASLTWSGVKSILSGEGDWLRLILGLFIWMIFLALTWLMAKSKPIMLITLITILVSFVLSFGVAVEYFVVLPFVLLFFILGSFGAIKEKDSRLKISAVKVFRAGFPWFLTGFCLLMVAVYYTSPLILKGENRIEIPRNVFNMLVEPMTAVVDGAINALPLTEHLGLSIENTEIMQETLYQTINQVINRYSQPYKEYLPLGLAAGLFLALKTISIAFMWLIILVGSLIFKILLVSGAVKKQERSVLQEFI